MGSTKVKQCFFEILREGRVKPVIGTLCITCRICFSSFDSEKSLFHTTADNLKRFQSFDGLPWEM